MKYIIPIVAGVVVIAGSGYYIWSMQSVSNELVVMPQNTSTDSTIQTEKTTPTSEKVMPIEEKKTEVIAMERKPTTNTAMEKKTTTVTTQTAPKPSTQNNESGRKITKDTSHLTSLQFEVTVNNGTEPAYKNMYWDNHEKGIYVDIIDGTPLFSSTDKYDSQTGWPSFTKGIDSDAVGYAFDVSAGMTRVEAFSNSSNAHLGHVFDDGPTDKGGKRFCINSASLRFIPYEKMKEAGYEKYLTLFQ